MPCWRHRVVSPAGPSRTGRTRLQSARRSTSRRHHRQHESDSLSALRAWLNRTPALSRQRLPRLCHPSIRRRCRRCSRCLPCRRCPATPACGLPTAAARRRGLSDSPALASASAATVPTTPCRRKRRQRRHEVSSRTCRLEDCRRTRSASLPPTATAVAEREVPAVSLHGLFLQSFIHSDM